jgi:hypothetical protein
MRGRKKFVLFSILLYGDTSPLISRYASEVSKLIGPVAFTLLKQGLDAYNTNKSKETSDSKEVMEDEEVILHFLADYYSEYVGPVAKRLALIKQK